MEVTNVMLSVVIPAFNAETTLGEQLGALTQQECGVVWEVLVCDNGSTDGTADLVRTWQEHMPNLRLVDASARRGPAAARNVGVAHATGELIAFCDADDVVGEGWLEAMRTALQHSTFVAGSAEGQRLNAGNRATREWTVDTVYRHDLLPQLPAAATNNMGIHKAVLEEVGGFEESLRTNEDTDLCWRVQLAGHPLVHHPEVVLHVRKRDGLRAVFRQAYTYGAGDKQLRHRYSRVVAAFAEAHVGGPEGTQEPASEGPSVASRLRGKVSKILSIRGRRDLVDRTRRIGHWLGLRAGRVDGSLPLVIPPAVLPGG